MRNLFGILLATALLSGAPPVEAQQQIQLTSGSGGNHFLPAMATRPDNGYVLAAWMTRDEADGSSSSIWVSLLKRSKRGKYSRKKPRKIASGTSRSAKIANRSPRVVWLAEAKQFYVVWSAGQPDGSANIQGRMVKAKSGKPKGQAILLAADGAVNLGPGADATSSDGQTDAMVSFYRRKTGDTSPFDFELINQIIDGKRGKPQGPSAGHDIGNGTSASIRAVLIMNEADVGRNQRAFPYVVELVTNPLDTSSCLLSLFGPNGDLVDQKVVPCGFLKRDSGNVFVHVYKKDGNWFRAEYFTSKDGVTLDRFSNGPVDIDAFALDDYIQRLDFADAARTAVGHGAPDGEIAVTHSRGSVVFTQLDAKGKGSTVATFDYEGGIFGLVAMAVGLEQAVAIWAGGASGSEQIVANVVDLPR
jgi:hypothetical protein